MGNFFDTLRRAVVGPDLGELWQETMPAGDALDEAIAPVIQEPAFYRRVYIPITMHICGPEKLFEFQPEGKQHCRRDGALWHTYNLGGRLSNGQLYLSPWGAGHEVAHNFSDVDHLCEGLEQEGLWTETHQAFGGLDHEAEPLISDAGHYEERDIFLMVHLCGPERLFDFHPEGKQHSGPFGGGRWDALVLGGPLPNGRLYVSQAALGRGLVRLVCGLDNPCEGL